MKRLFTLTITEDKKQSDLEGEQIASVCMKCKVCGASYKYTTNDYSNAIDEINHFINTKDWILKCSCKYNQLVATQERGIKRK